jgi:hypothetical protein
MGSDLGKPVSFWIQLLAMHDDFKAIGGEKKRREIVQALKMATQRASGTLVVLQQSEEVESTEEVSPEAPRVGDDET